MANTITIPVGTALLGNLIEHAQAEERYARDAGLGTVAAWEEWLEVLYKSDDSHFDNSNTPGRPKRNECPECGSGMVIGSGLESPESGDHTVGCFECEDCGCKWTATFTISDQTVYEGGNTSDGS